MFRVLVVDDDENVNMFISRLLNKKFKCEVAWAKNGLEALSLIKDFKPEVLFLDITMPVMNGIETLTALRSDNETKLLPVIMLTAVSEKNIVAEIMRLGVFDYMLKPLIYDTTILRIKEIFERIKKTEDERKIAKPTQVIYEPEGTESIMFVGLDNDVKKILHLKFERFFSIIETDNGVEAYKLFLADKPKTIIFNENIPLLNEFILGQKIRANSSRG
ncbi:MAG TPA: response regulator, partial [Melioribacteraceae bacterium]|nr:response regulator [Melioribacteraceae bacterium]